MKAVASSGSGFFAALALCAVNSVVACGGAAQVPPNEASRESTQTASAGPPSATSTPPTTVSTSAASAASNPLPASGSVPAAPLPSTSPTQSTTTPPFSTTDTWGHPTGDTAGPTPTEADVSNLSDAQLAAVIEAVDDGEIRLAQLGMTHATRPGVKRFAHELLVAYELMASRNALLWSRLHLEPAINSASSQIDVDTQKQVALLAGLRSADFDPQYVTAQVHAQSKALALLDAIIASAKGSAFKTDMTAARPKLEGYLRMAQSALEQEQKGVTNRQPTGPVPPSTP